jgi:hypothetical protein
MKTLLADYVLIWRRGKKEILDECKFILNEYGT